MIDPEDETMSSFSVSKSASACDGKTELVSRELEGLTVGCAGGGGHEGAKGEGEREQEGPTDGHEGCQWVPALFVFGGIDTAGNIHSDSFVLVPH